MITKDTTRLQDTPDIGLEPFKKHFCQLGLIRGEDYDQERMNIEYHLRFDGHKVYQEADLGDERILDRALRLLYRARFGQGAKNARISVHVKYPALPEKMRGARGPEEQFVSSWPLAPKSERPRDACPVRVCPVRVARLSKTHACEMYAL
jgi:hypothetical protein